MSASSVEVVLLCEDRQDEVFIRRFLQRRGRERYAFRSLISPAGRGSGEQWVREQFPCELKAHRSQAGRRNTWLIVATDADTQSVDDRIRGLCEACKGAGIPFRHPNERVMFVVPKRSIETWFAFLRGETVNESDRHPKYDCENDCRDQVARLDDMCRQQKLEPEPPPSLSSACEEFARLKDR